VALTKCDSTNSRGDKY